MFKFIKSDFNRCVATFVGGSLGVGIFSVPFVFAENGVIISSILFILLSILVLTVHLMAVDVSELTPTKSRLVGQARYYFGDYGKWFMGVSTIGGSIITLLVYVLVAGTFLQLLFDHIGIYIDPTIWRTIFWIFMSGGIFFGLHNISKAEVVLGFLFMLVLAMFLVQGIPHIEYESFTKFSFGNIFVSWSVIVFALFHLASIAESHEVVKTPKKYKEAVFIGTVIVAIFSILFALVVVGVTNGETSTEAISSISEISKISSNLFVAGALIGLLAITTSFFVSGLNLRDILRYDFKVDKKISSFVVVFSTLPFLFLDIEDILTLLVLAGVIIGSIKGCCVIAMHILVQKRHPRKTRGLTKMPIVFHCIMFCIFILGGLYSIIALLLS